MRTSKSINIRYFVFWSRSLNLFSSYTLCNCSVAFGKGGLISESFSLWLHPPENVPNHYPEHLLFRGLVDAQDSDFAHFLEDGNAFWDSATLKKTMSEPLRALKSLTSGKGRCFRWRSYKLHVPSFSLQHFRW